MRDSENSTPLFLRILQLADSALPIGATAHSFGWETLAEEGGLTPDNLESLFVGYLEEEGAMEAAFCRSAHRLSRERLAAIPEKWTELNARLSALKPGRESRAASATLGRRFLQIVVGLTESPILSEAIEASRTKKGEMHHAPAFGLAGGALGFGEDETVLARLQQTVTGMVSACQRLMPLGQNRAMRLLWELGPVIQRAALRGHEEEIFCFAPILDAGAMRHPLLETRLFIS
jgi:urease accessory protein